MKALRLIIALFLIIGYIIGLTNNLMPRCESESAHLQHIVSIHLNHFHSADENHELAHIGHEEHDESSLINILQHLFDDIENPKEKCEFGFFASIHNFNADVKSPALVNSFKSPDLFTPRLEEPINSFEYITPYYSPPDSRSRQQRGPPFFLV